MSHDRRSDVGKAAVGKFDPVPVGKLVVTVGRGEMLLEEVEESSSQVGLYVGTEWWVEPYYVSTTFLLGFLVRLVFEF